jgi:hypothetical protein
MRPIASAGNAKELPLIRAALRAVAELVGNEGGVVSGVFNLESFDVEASDWRPRHDKHYHEPDSLQPATEMAVDLFDNWFDPIETEVRARRVSSSKS